MRVIRTMGRGAQAGAADAGRAGAARRRGIGRVAMPVVQRIVADVRGGDRRFAAMRRI